MYGHFIELFHHPKILVGNIKPSKIKVKSHPEKSLKKLINCHVFLLCDTRQVTSLNNQDCNLNDVVESIKYKNKAGFLKNA